MKNDVKHFSVVSVEFDDDCFYDSKLFNYLEEFSKKYDVSFSDAIKSSLVLSLFSGDEK